MALWNATLKWVVCGGFRSFLWRSQTQGGVYLGERRTNQQLGELRTALQNLQGCQAGQRSLICLDSLLVLNGVLGSGQRWRRRQCYNTSGQGNRTGTLTRAYTTDRTGNGHTTSNATIHTGKTTAISGVAPVGYRNLHTGTGCQESPHVNAQCSVPKTVEQTPATCEASSTPYQVGPVCNTFLKPHPLSPLSRQASLQLLASLELGAMEAEALPSHLLEYTAGPDQFFPPYVHKNFDAHVHFSFWGKWPPKSDTYDKAQAHPTKPCHAMTAKSCLCLARKRRESLSGMH